MSKPKNRIYCPIAMRPKMLFETKVKAMRFIEMNADDFEGEKRPVRAYFCEGCGGWHVTHRDKWENIKRERRKKYETESSAHHCDGHVYA